jgi:hypothetical protein
MRAIDCPCGHRLKGADEELIRLAREPSRMERTDDELRSLVTAGAYDV